MRAAIKPRGTRDETRLLVARRGSAELTELIAARLPEVLRRGDLLVVNDAAALPASLRTEDGELEFRLTAPIEDGRAAAVAFGAGDWRMRTEDRPAPRVLNKLDRFIFRGGLRAHLDSVAGREVVLHFDAPQSSLPAALYGAADPIQYSYLAQKLELWDIQTIYGSRPWAVEAPSAGFALSFATLKALMLGGVNIASVTHAAGLSSTGDEVLDRKFPAPERFEIPEETVRRIGDAKANGGRVVAVGTTVVRALEGAAVANGGVLRAGSGITALRLSPASKLHVVDALLTGVHEPIESHFQLMGAFADELLQRRITDEAERRGFQTHEFGDAVLLLPD